MNRDFSKVTSQVAASYLLQDKWCTEYTSSHYKAEELNLLCLNLDSKVMVPRYEFMRFFRVVPDQATGMTKRDIVRAYVVNASTAINDLHLELEYTEDSKYDMALDIFCRRGQPVPFRMLPDHIIEAFRVIGLIQMDDYCNSMFNLKKIAEFQYTVDVSKFAINQNNVKAFSYDYTETLY